MLDGRLQSDGVLDSRLQAVEGVYADSDQEAILLLPGEPRKTLNTRAYLSLFSLSLLSSLSSGTRTSITRWR